MRWRLAVGRRASTDELRQAAFAEDWALSVGQGLSIVPMLVGLVLLLRGSGGRAGVATEATAD